MSIADTAVQTPAWVHDAVFYQIFPDRFAKSPTVEKPAHLEPWDSDPTDHGYKGGDLVGVIERLDYIQSLGVTALYFNPIFQSASNHRYHTHDYYQVDPLLGGNEAFDRLLAECHRRGLRVVLDGVFNHASRGFFPFNDILENGAASPWLDWFTVHEHPANAYDHNRPPGYRAWVGLHALPAFNTDDPQVREYLMRVGEYWVRRGIDGWRLDVPGEIRTPGFWAEFRQRVRAINPACYIVGEIWGDAREWLQGDQFDATMNYLFTGPVLAFAGRHRVVPGSAGARGYEPYPGIDARAYADRIQKVQSLYAWPIQLAQLNLLDSHDTWRALSVLGGDARSYELASLLQFTYPGAPSIYAGSELGVDGAARDTDRWARKSMPWNHEERWDQALLTTTRQLAALRHAHPVLRTGAYIRLTETADTCVFLRQDAESRLLVAVNTGDGPDRVTVDGASVDDAAAARPIYRLGDEPEIELADGSVTLGLPARSGVVVELPGT